MYGYVYYTFDQKHGKYYVGQHKGEFTEDYLGSGIILKRKINKYGRDYFNVFLVKCCKTKEELDKEEIKFIKKIKKRFPKDCYNIADGGDGGVTLEKGTLKYEENRKLKSEITKNLFKNKEYYQKYLNGRPRGKNHHQYNKPMSDYTKQKLYEANKGKKYSKEQKEKMSQDRKGHLKNNNNEKLNILLEASKKSRDRKTHNRINNFLKHLIKDRNFRNKELQIIFNRNKDYIRKCLIPVLIKYNYLIKIKNGIYCFTYSDFI